MKKLLVLTLPILLLSSCSLTKKISYGDLMEKVKPHVGEIIYNYTYDGMLFTEDFFVNEERLLLHLKEEKGSIKSHTYITFLFQDEIPEKFNCYFIYELSSTTPKTTIKGDYDIDNTYSDNDQVNLYHYSGPLAVKDKVDDLAKTTTTLALASFNNWMLSDLNTSFKAAGLFPKLKASVKKNY